MNVNTYMGVLLLTVAGGILIWTYRAKLGEAKTLLAAAGLGAVAAFVALWRTRDKPALEEVAREVLQKQADAVQKKIDDAVEDVETMDNRHAKQDHGPADQPSSLTVDRLNRLSAKLRARKDK